MPTFCVRCCRGRTSAVTLTTRWRSWTALLYCLGSGRVPCRSCTMCHTPPCSLPLHIATALSLPVGRRDDLYWYHDDVPDSDKDCRDGVARALCIATVTLFGQLRRLSIIDAQGSLKFVNALSAMERQGSVSCHNRQTLVKIRALMFSACHGLAGD